MGTNQQQFIFFPFFSKQLVEVDLDDRFIRGVTFFLLILSLPTLIFYFKNNNFTLLVLLCISNALSFTDVWSYLAIFENLMGNLAKIFKMVLFGSRHIIEGQIWTYCLFKTYKSISTSQATQSNSTNTFSKPNQPYQYSFKTYNIDQKPTLSNFEGPPVSNNSLTTPNATNSASTNITIASKTSQIPIKHPLVPCFRCGDKYFPDHQCNPKTCNLFTGKGNGWSR